MITGAQIRAARTAVRFTIEELAQRASVNARTIMRYEQVDDVPGGRISTVMALKRALEAAGIEFIGTPDDGPGIRLRRKPPSA